MNRNLRPQRSKKFLSKSIVFFVLPIVLISLYGWLLYLPFLEGYISGLYPIATTYAFILGFLTMLLLWVIFFRFPTSLYTIVFIILCVLIPIIKKRKIIRSIGIVLVTPPLLLVLFLPSLASCNPIQSLTIERWNKTYHAVYSAAVFDDTYGNLLLFECDRSGIFCHRIRSHHDSFMVRNGAQLVDRADRNEMELKIGEAIIFAIPSPRSKN